MQLRPDIQIPSMLKAMVEVITPAIDPANELAMQQAQLMVGHLALIMQNMPLQYRADRDELDRLVAYARDIRGMGEGDEALDAAIDSAADVLDRGRAAPDELVGAIHGLTAALDEPIRSLADNDDAKAQEALMRATLDMSEVQLLHARSSLLMQGWEPEPGLVPAIERLLAPIPVRPVDER